MSGTPGTTPAEPTPCLDCGGIGEGVADDHVAHLHGGVGAALAEIPTPTPKENA